MFSPRSRSYFASFRPSIGGDIITFRPFTYYTVGPQRYYVIPRLTIATPTMTTAPLLDHESTMGRLGWHGSLPSHHLPLFATNFPSTTVRPDSPHSSQHIKHYIRRGLHAKPHPFLAGPS